jgi:hypothetical protein
MAQANEQHACSPVVRVVSPVASLLSCAYGGFESAALDPLGFVGGMTWTLVSFDDQ